MVNHALSRVLKRTWGRLPRALREAVFQPRTPLERWNEWHRFYDVDPFRVAGDPGTPAEYRTLAREAASSMSEAFLERVRSTTGFLPDPRRIAELAESTQIVRRPEGQQNNYAHGFLLYGLIRAMADTGRGSDNLVVLETGTARGFSTICMAMALADADRAGTILTIDVLHSDRPILWNSIADASGPKTRFELLAEWRQLLERYVVFLRGRSEIVIEQLGLQRIHFAFLDGAHDYEHVRAELEFVAARQRAGDRILCDDYSETEFPGIVEAVEEFLARGEYSASRFDSAPTRSHLLLERNDGPLPSSDLASSRSALGDGPIRDE